MGSPPHRPEGEAVQRKQIPLGTLPYYAVCGLGGVLSCGGTHTLIVPLDLLKCRMQVDPKRYMGLSQAARLSVAEEGVRVLARGWAPTIIGYSAQGACKFGLYEVFKKYYSKWLGEERAHAYRGLIYVAAGATAEAIADVTLTPFEAVRMQTSPTAPRTMRECLPLMYKQEGLSGLYKGLAPLWLRQIPYTASKFVAFELALEKVYGLAGKKPATCSTAERLTLTFIAGCFAGVICAVCSHPPDVVVSLMYKDSRVTVGQAIKSLGFAGLWRGLQTRILMIASIAALQLFVVDSVKVAFNVEKAKTSH